MRPRASTAPAAESEAQTARGRLARQRFTFTPRAFVQSARDGRRVVVEQFLTAGINKDTKDETGDTALIAATRNDRREVIRLLMDHGADLNQTGVEGLTALMIALRSGHLGIVDALLENRANLNARSRREATAADVHCLEPQSGARPKIDHCRR
ncbi:MAG: ankyrin repeat domain-containing protein [Pyrinomonadaceae bacterium]